MSFIALFPLSPFAALASGSPLPEPGTHGHYAVLTGRVHTPPPFPRVDFVYGPRQAVGGTVHVWWQLEARAGGNAETPPLFTLRALTSRDPLDGSSDPLGFERYILRIPETGETLEYRNVHTGRALLPGWRDFEVQFVPRRARGTYLQGGLPETAEYLGHTLTLQGVDHGVPWEAWEEVRVLSLDPELLVGTGRNFRDQEGHRLPQVPERRNYTYIPFIEGEYRVMIEAGINLFLVDAKQSAWVRSEPVFYRRGPEGDPPLRYPADLYRSNYLGSVMFMDEPAIIMRGDPQVRGTLRYFSDAASLLQKRIRERYQSRKSYSGFQLEQALIDAGVNFGDLRLEQYDFPAWETLFETAYYQLAAGLEGIVHEGRYRLEPFDEAMARWSDTPRRHTVEELLRYHYAFLRGAARAFETYWGTSIYGQCDPEISPRAITLAYDLGARYIWFWTSDHDHHMPWPEQLELARLLRDHAAEHPRPSIFGPPPTLDKAIVIPYGYFLSLENFQWIGALDPEGKSEAWQRYNRLLRRAIREIQRAMEEGQDFDLVVDGGQEIRNYREIVRISDEK